MFKMTLNTSVRRLSSLVYRRFYFFFPVKELQHTLVGAYKIKIVNFICGKSSYFRLENKSVGAFTR